MKMICCFFALLLSHLLSAQNVGINVENPTRPLSVNGSIMVDALNKNTGTLDSACLLFGGSGAAGIGSPRAGNRFGGLDFYTEGNQRMSLDQAGRLKIGAPITNGTGLLQVGGGVTVDFGDVRIRSSTVIGGNATEVNHVLAVRGNTYLDGDVAVNATNPTIQLKQEYTNKGFLQLSGDNIRIGTNSGNSEGNFVIRNNGGDRVTVDAAGNMDVQGKLISEGKAVMLSNSSTTLRAGFSAGSFTLSLSAGTFLDVTFIVPSFTGNNSNIRVSVAQFQPGAGASNWGSVVMTPHSVDASDASYSNASTVKVRFHNAGTSTANLGSNAVLYLHVVVTD